MDIRKPIPDRTTEQLMDILERKEHWLPDVVNAAHNELMKRGVLIHVQPTRPTIRSKFKKEIESIKARTAFTTNEKIIVVLLGSILVFLLHDLIPVQSGKEYKKKNKQGFLYLMLGIGFWFLTLYILL